MSDVCHLEYGSRAFARGARKKVRGGSERRAIAEGLIAEKGLTISQACRIAQIYRKTYRYAPKRCKENEMIKSSLRE